MVYGSGGYRKLSDESMEQPPAALKRVERRSLFNIAAAFVVTTATCAAGAGGLYYLFEAASNAPQGSTAKYEEGTKAGLIIQSEQIRKIKND